MTDEQVYDDNKWLMVELQAARYEADRLTAERDDLLARVRTAEWQASWQSRAEAAEADLAAARAALEAIANPPTPRQDAESMAEITLSRLGTGEALAAVRERDAVASIFLHRFQEMNGFGASDADYELVDRAEKSEGRLRAAFGEGARWRSGEGP